MIIQPRVSTQGCTPCFLPLSILPPLSFDGDSYTDGKLLHPAGGTAIARDHLRHVPEQRGRRTGDARPRRLGAAQAPALTPASGGCNRA